MKLNLPGLVFIRFLSNHLIAVSLAFLRPESMVCRSNFLDSWTHPHKNSFRSVCVTGITDQYNIGGSRVELSTTSQANIQVSQQMKNIMNNIAHKVGRHQWLIKSKTQPVISQHHMVTPNFHVFPVSSGGRALGLRLIPWYPDLSPIQAKNYFSVTKFC